MANELIPYFELRTPEVVANCKAQIDKAVATSDDVVTVRISTKLEKRSQAQNRLYWLWLGEIAKKTGSVADYYHLFFKRQFLLSIYYRDDPGFAAMCDAIRALKGVDYPKYHAIGSEVINRTSSTTATVPQMTEYLSRIFAYCYFELGILLPIPKEMQREEKGIYRAYLQRQDEREHSGV